MNRMKLISGITIASLVLLLIVAVAGCGGTSTTATTATIAAAVPDWGNYGYTVAGSKDLTPGQSDTVTAGSITIQVPSNVFSNPVKFEVLTLPDVTTLQGKFPNSTPIVAFAFRVTDKTTGQLIGSFSSPVMAIIKDPGITAQSVYYNITVDGAVSLNPTGTQAKAGELDHPESAATVAWAVVTPTGGTSTGGTTTNGTTTGGGTGGGTSPPPYQSPY